MLIDKILVPTLIINRQKVKANLQKIYIKAQYNNVCFRPHFKTHQSVEIGDIFKDFKITKITVSSLKMAKFFASNGWNDILIGIVLNVRELTEINELASKIKLSIVIDSLDAFDFIQKHITNKIGVYIKVECNYSRTGIEYSNYQLIDEIARRINNNINFKFIGLLSHFGNTYSLLTAKSVINEYQSSLSKLIQINEKINKSYKSIISVGDTPSCSIIEKFENIDEIRPGNFIYYDLMQLKIGSCKFSEIATIMACPIISKNDNRLEIIVYCGAVHLSKDKINIYKVDVYGLPVKINNDLTWSEPIIDSYVKSLSQEHGIIKMNSEDFKKFKIGDIIGIVPVHSCLTADLNKKILIV